MLAAQEQNNRFNNNKQEEVGYSGAAQNEDNIFRDGNQDEVVTSLRGPGTDTPGGDLEYTEPLPIDKHSGWLFIIGIAIIIYYTVQRKKMFSK